MVGRFVPQVWPHLCRLKRRSSYSAGEFVADSIAGQQCSPKPLQLEWSTLLKRTRVDQGVTTDEKGMTSDANEP